MSRGRAKPGLELTSDDLLLDPSPAWPLTWIGTAFLVCGALGVGYLLYTGEGSFAAFLIAGFAAFFGAQALIIGFATNVIARRLG